MVLFIASKSVQGLKNLGNTICISFDFDQFSLNYFTSPPEFIILALSRVSTPIQIPATASSLIKGKIRNFTPKKKEIIVRYRLALVLVPLEIGFCHK